MQTDTLPDGISNFAESIYEVSVAPGWVAKVKVAITDSGDFIATELTVCLKDFDALSNVMLPQVLRSIKVSELVQSAIEDHEEVDQQYSEFIATQNLTELERKKWIKEIEGDWTPQGRKPYDISLYAKTAAFYVDETLRNPHEPTKALAKQLDVKRSTIARRLDRARKLDLLSRSFDGAGNSGKASGWLTPKALEILGRKSGGE